MRVLFVIPTLESCGPTTVLFNIVKHLDLTEFDPSVLTLSPEPSVSDFSEFTSSGLPVFSLGRSRVAGLFSGRRAFREFLRRGRFGVINTHGLRPDLLAASFSAGVPVVSTVHNELHADYCMTYGRLAGRCMTKLHLRAMSKLAAVVGCSECVASSLRRCGIDASFIRNGVDTDLYRPVAEDEKSALRQRLGLPENGQIVVSAGNLSQRKDPLTVIEAFSRSKLRESGTLVLLGDGPLEQECARRAESADARVMVAGRVNNVRDYLMAADYYVSASRAEGLPVAVVEGLACGLPACLSAIPPHEEIKTVKPPACELFEPGNAEALASALDKITAERSPERSEAALSAVTEHLNAKRMSQEYQRLFKEYDNRR